MAIPLQQWLHERASMLRCIYRVIKKCLHLMITIEVSGAQRHLITLYIDCLFKDYSNPCAEGTCLSRCISFLRHRSLSAFKFRDIPALALTHL